MRDGDNQWHLDKKVPIAIVFAMFIHTVGFVWLGATWKSEVDSRLQSLERSEAERRPQEARLIRLEEKMLSLLELMQRIDKKLDARP